MTTTPITPNTVRELLVGLGFDTELLDIQPSRHGVTITSRFQAAADRRLITDVHAALHLTKHMREVTRRSPFLLKIHTRPKRR